MMYIQNIYVNRKINTEKLMIAIMAIAKDVKIS